MAWPKEHLEENLTFIADSLGPKATSSPVTRSAATSPRASTNTTCRCTNAVPSTGCSPAASNGPSSASSTCTATTKAPWPGCVPSTSSRSRARSPPASTTGRRQSGGELTAHRRKLQKEQDTLEAATELLAFDEKLRHSADQRISLDLDDGVKVNYGKFGDLLAEVKAVTGGIEET